MTRRELEHTAKLEDKIESLILENIQLRCEIDNQEKQIQELSDKLKEYTKNES